MWPGCLDYMQPVRMIVRTLREGVPPKFVEGGKYVLWPPGLIITSKTGNAAPHQFQVKRKHLASARLD